MLEGDLGDFSLPEVLQLLDFTNKSGRLRLHGPSTAGCIVLENGDLKDVSADVARVGVVRRLLGLGHVDVAPIESVLGDADDLLCDRQLLTRLVERDALDADLARDIGQAQALEEFSELLRWTQGSFRFDVDADAAAGIDLDLDLSNEDLLAAATERLAAWDDVIERIGDGGQVVTITPPVPLREVTVPADGWNVLPFIDGRHSIDRLAELTGQGALDTRRALLELIDASLVRLDAPEEGTDDSVADALARIIAIEARHHPGAAVEAAAAFGKGSRDDADGAFGSERSLDDDAPNDHDVDHDVALDIDSDSDVEVAQNDSAAADLAALDGGDTDVDDGPGLSPPLRATVRPERLQTDPNIDEDLVSKLIDGVKEL